MAEEDGNLGMRDARFMTRALELAQNGLGLSSPNPMVGAVVVRDDDIVGEGWHEGTGTQHAETLALRAAGGAAPGSTLYVTLEPCSHHGHTPPCAPAIVEAGVARVVAAARDPNPAVDGRGFGILREAGVEVVEGVLEDQALELIRGFSRHVRTGLPFVMVKMAASLDGKVAAPDGSSRWVTGARARRDVHRLRAGSDAIIVGGGTALADDPALTVRLEGYRGRQPLRVIVDGRGNVPPTARLFDGKAPTLVATTSTAPDSVRTAWEAAGAEVAIFEEDDDHPAGTLPLQTLMAFLGKREVQSVLVEGGPTLAWLAVDHGVVDRLVLYMAPKLIGGRDAPGVLGGSGIQTMTGAVPVSIRSIERIGQDLKVVADVHRHR